MGVEMVPVWPPAFFLAGAAAIAQAVAWSLTGFPNIRMAALIVLAFPLLVLWLEMLRAQGRFDPTTGTWLSPPLAQWLRIAALTPIAYLVALAGVARDRRGGSLGMPTVREWIERVRDLMPSRSKAFASPEGAQFWYEWRRCGGWAPVVSAILGSLFLMMLSLLPGAEDEPVAYRILRNLLTFAPLFAFVLGLSLSRQMSRSVALKKKSGFDAFAATRPLEDAAFPRAVFRAAAASVLALWATLWALTFLCGGLLVLSGRSDAVGDALNDSRLGVAIFGVAIPTDWRLLLHLGRCLVAGIAFMGISASFALDRRLDTVACILFVACIWFKAGVEMGYAPMAPWGWDIVGLSLLPWPAIHFAQAWRRGCLDARTVGVAFASWCLLAGVLGSFWLEVAPVRPHHVLLILGVSALPTTALALGRTTLAQSRHQ
jgi:hypothetical protein